MLMDDALSEAFGADNSKEDGPSVELVSQLQKAYDFYNEALFEGRLGPCMILLHRKKGALGYFGNKRWTNSETGIVYHELALNPEWLNRGIEASLATLVHEMVHLWQEDFGTVSKVTHHNVQWANKMISLGLMPSHTGRPGGKRTGMRVSHYIMDEGKFKEKTAEFLATGFTLKMAAGGIGGGSSQKQYYTLHKCGACNTKARAKTTAHLICGCNGQRMEVQG